MPIYRDGYGGDINTAVDTFIDEGNPTWNNGTKTKISVRPTGGGNAMAALLMFNLAAVPAGSTCNSAVLHLFCNANNVPSEAQTYTLYAIAVGNAGWVEGTKSSAQAGAGEPCWAARAANGSGGVTTPWAGSAGMQTSGTDYVATPLGTVVFSGASTAGQEMTVNLPTDVVATWFGFPNQNYGILIAGGTTRFTVWDIASAEHATTGWRPYLDVDWTAGGAPEQTVTPTGIASDEAFGTPVLAMGTAQAITPTGIAGGEAFGAAVILGGLQTVAPAGIATDAAFGTLTVFAPLTGIDDLILEWEDLIGASGIPSGEAFGGGAVLPGVLLVQPEGIGSGEAFGALLLTPGAVLIAPSGMASLEAFGSALLALAGSPAQTILPEGIPSAESVPGPVLQVGAVTILASAIETGEAFGAPVLARSGEILVTGIASAEAFGAAQLQTTLNTIWERVQAALSILSIPRAASVYIAPSGSAYPDAYLVYFVISGVPAQHADDAEKSRSYHVQVSYYSRSGLAGMPDVPGAMTGAGFTRGSEHEIPYNQQTRHFGLALEFFYLEEQE